MKSSWSFLRVGIQVLSKGNRAYMYGGYMTQALNKGRKKLQKADQSKTLLIRTTLK